MSTLDVSTEDKFFEVHEKHFESHNQLMRNLLLFQDQLTKSEVRLSTTIVFKLGDILNRLYNFHRIVRIKASCKDNNTVHELTLMNMKTRNESELIFDKLRNATMNITVDEFVFQLRSAIFTLSLLFDATIKVDNELNAHY